MSGRRNMRKKVERRERDLAQEAARNRRLLIVFIVLTVLFVAILVVKPLLTGMVPDAYQKLFEVTGALVLFGLFIGAITVLDVRKRSTKRMDELEGVIEQESARLK